MAAIGAIPIVARDASTASAQDPTVILRAGDGETGYSINRMLPEELSVEEGAVVRWTFPWKEIHTVTFGQPQGDPTVPSPGAGTDILEYDGTGFITSGIMRDGGQFDVQFTAPGVYPYFCVIHPGQEGVVTVVEAGEETDSQEDVNARGNAEYDQAITAAKALAAQLSAQEVQVTPKENGGNTYTVEVGAISEGQDDLQQFFPAEIDIAEGDSILWVSDIITPHTVTFGELPPGDPFEAPVTNPEDGFDGTGLVHSGILGIDWPHGLEFEVEFTEAGSYDYVCVLHADQGMVGTVNVAAAQEPTPTATATTAPPTATATATTPPATSTSPPATATKKPPSPPNTGSGSATEDGGTNAWLLAAFGGLVVIGAGTGAIAARRNRR